MGRILGITAEQEDEMHVTIPRALVVTRHAPLAEYLREIGLIDETTQVVEHVTAADVCGRDVIGVLPLRLAVDAASVTEVPLDLTMADRGAMSRGDLPIERIREIAGEPVTYKVRRVPMPGRRLVERDVVYDLSSGWMVWCLVDGDLEWHPLRSPVPISSNADVDEIERAAIETVEFYEGCSLADAHVTMHIID
jgi:hypothetical protein